VYYLAPRATTWDTCVSEFQRERVLYESIRLRPSEIEEKLADQGVADGWHRAVYDQSTTFVFSEPIRLNEQNAGEIASTVRVKIDEHRERADVVMKEIQASLDRIREIRHPTRSDDEAPDPASYFAAAPKLCLSRDQIVAGRRHRLEALRARAATEADAIFAAVGLEMWAIGAQLITVTLSD
jgi:hypothetical protein